MKTVTQSFLDAWIAKQGKGGYLYVQYKRRYWNGAAYVEEANWTQYTMRDFVEVGQITWKLDTPLLNDVKTSSVIVKFKNNDYQMLPSNTGGGLFAADATAAIGYEPFLMPVRILFGYKLADGTVETVTLFTGVAIDYLFRPKDGYVEVTVSGNEALLQYADAELVSDVLTGAPATNSGSNQFTTTHAGIAFITNVYDAGVLKIQGTDYTVTNTGVYGAGAVIQLSYAAVGAITYDGAAWQTLQKIEDLVVALAEQAGLASYNVSPVVFPGAAGATTTEIGMFAGAAFGTVWTNSYGTAGGSGLDGVLTVTTPGVSVYSTPSAPAYGIFTFPLEFLHTLNLFSVALYFISNQPTYTTGLMHGYYLTFADSLVGLERTDGGASHTLLASGGLPAGLDGDFRSTSAGDPHTWIVTRGGDGLFSVFCDGLLVLSATDNNYVASGYFVVEGTGDGGLGSGSLTIGPIVNQTNISLTMANFSGMTCYDAIQKLARLADYEWGFAADGVLFFRSKTPASLVPAVTVTQSSKISEIMEFRPGYADVVNVAKVTYGSYYRKYDSSSAPETAPTSQARYLNQILSEDYSGFLLAYDPIIAAGRAQNLHDNNYRARRRARIKCQIVPQLDLSDVMQYSFYNNPRNVDNVFGDPLELWGTTAFGAPTDVLARSIQGKVIGMVLDPNTCQGEYEVQEVLS